MGLALAMTACLLIYLYVSNEIRYDAFNEKSDRIYRVVTYVQDPSEEHFFGSPAAMGPAILHEFPQVQMMTRIMQQAMMVQKPAGEPTQEGMLIADSSFFSIFTLPILNGSASQALVEPFSVVLTQSASRKYFGNADPIGQTLIFDKQYNCKVTAVMKDFPPMSHFHSDIIVSMTTLSKMMPGRDSTEWNSFSGHTYLLLPDKSYAGQLQARLPAFIEKYAGLVMKEAKVKFTLTLEPLRDIYLHSKYGSQESGNATNVYIFSFAAILILLIACVNFINLSSAVATERAKETGIRKLLGSTRERLIAQFLTESIVYCLIAFIIACILASLLLPFFNEMSGKTIIHHIFEYPSNILLLLTVMLVIALISGFYPAWVLSSYKAMLVLKGRFSSSRKGVRIRQSLVVFQFAIAVVLMIGTIVTSLQLKYMRDQPIGFKKDQMLVMTVPGNPETDKHYQVYKNELSKIPGVLSVSVSSGIPGSNYGNILVDIENASGEMQRAGIDMMGVDDDFFSQYKIPLLAGNAPTIEMLSQDMENVVINEATLRKLGYTDPNEAIGKRFQKKGKIIAVVKDFHYRSLREHINPLLMIISNRFFRFLTLDIKNEHVPATMAAVESKWKQLAPEADFDAKFLDDSFNSQYKGEDTFGRLFMYFAILAILVSCMGLFGLAIFTTLQRTKEIGIRKVIGAPVSVILLMIIKDFLIPVFISLFVAFPVAWYVMNRWLNDFAYRIHFDWWVFVVAGFCAVIVAIVAVSIQSLKAALASPVKSLRTD
jgi:putative ABC transport system permease protein